MKPIADLIVEEIEKRKKQGIETYGKVLEPFNERDATQDALEEALDLAHYIKQWQIERKELLGFIYEIYINSQDEALVKEAEDLLFKTGYI